MSEVRKPGRRTSRARIHGIRRRDRRRRPGRPFGGHPSQAAARRSNFGRRAGKRLRGWRTHPLRRGCRPDRRSTSCCPTGETMPTPVQDAGHRRPLSLPDRPAAPSACRISLHAAADEQSRRLCRLAGQCLPLAGAAKPKRSASKSTPALPPPRCSMTRTARSSASPPATWGSARTARPGPNFQRGMALARQIHPVRRGRARFAGQAADRQLRPREGREPQKFGIGIKELWEVAPAKHQPGLVLHSFGWPLADDTGGGSFLYHLERQPRRRRLCRPPQLQEPLAVAVRGIPALQDASAIRDTSRAASVRLWRARHHRRRLAVRAEARFPRRRADRLLGRFPQRAAHQGQPQRHAVRHARRRAVAAGCAAGRQRRTGGLRRRLARRPTSARTCRGCATSSRCGRVSARSLGIGLGGLDMWLQHAVRLVAVRHAETRQARYAASSRPRTSSRSTIPSRTASSPSTGCPRFSSRTPTTRRTSRRTCMSPTWTSSTLPNLASMAGRRRGSVRRVSTSGSTRMETP